MGALEQRMGVVEQEMQVLKAQIQTLLLEIQEQLLNNTYPTLRAQEPARAQQVQQHAPQAAPQPPHAPEPAKRMTLEQIEQDVFDDEETLELPRQHQQRVQQQAQQTRAQQPPRQQPPPQQHQQQPQQRRQAQPYHMEVEDYSDEQVEEQRGEYLMQQTDVRAWIEIDKWVSGKINEIGIKRTRDLINLYDGQERDLLMQFLKVYEEESAAPPPPSPARSLFPQAQRGEPRNNKVLPTSRDQWQQPQSAASRAKNATYTPFNEHQEMVLRLIADMVGNSNGDMPRASNGNGNGAKH